MRQCCSSLKRATDLSDADTVVCICNIYVHPHPPTHPPTHPHPPAHPPTPTLTHRFLEIAQPFEDRDILKYMPRLYHPCDADDLVASAALPATPVSPGAQVELNSRESTAMSQRSMLHLDAPVLHLDSPERSLALNLARSSEPKKSGDLERNSRNELERRLLEERASQLLECDVTRCVNLVTSLVTSQHPALAQLPQKHEQELRELKRKCDDDDSVDCSPLDLEITIEQAHATKSRDREREREDEAGGEATDNLKVGKKELKATEDADTHRRGRTLLGVDARVLDLLVFIVSFRERGGGRSRAHARVRERERERERREGERLYV